MKVCECKVALLIVTKQETIRETDFLARLTGIALLVANCFDFDRDLHYRLV